MKCKLVFLCLTAFIILLVSGCLARPYSEFYQPIAPVTYPPTQKMYVFNYQNVDLDELYKQVFADYIPIGRASFTGPYRNPNLALDFGKSLGTDILITSAQYTDTQTSVKRMYYPTFKTTYINGGYGSSGGYNSTTCETQSHIYTQSVDRYLQKGMFLRNSKSSIPLWEQTIKNYEKTTDNPLEGTWSNTEYTLEVFQSGDQIVAFISGNSPKDRFWKPGDLKMQLNASTGEGIYLMKSRAPMPIKMDFQPNKFGYLQGKFPLFNNEVINFQKK